MSIVAVRYRPFLRLVAMLVVCLFLAESICWANPDIRGSAVPSRNDLQVQSMFSPIIGAAGWEREAQVRLELACIMQMALGPNPAPFQDINAEIDNWLSVSGTQPRERVLDVVSNPETEGGRRIVTLRIFRGADVGRAFRLCLNCSSLGELALTPDKVTVETIDGARTSGPARPDQDAGTVALPEATAVQETGPAGVSVLREGNGTLDPGDGEPQAAKRVKRFEDTGFLPTGTFLESELGATLSGQAKPIRRGSGKVVINRSPALMRSPDGGVVIDVTSSIWDNVLVGPELGIPENILRLVQMTYFLSALYNFHSVSASTPEGRIRLQGDAKLMRDKADKELARLGVRVGADQAAQVSASAGSIPRGRSDFPDLDEEIILYNVEQLELMVLQAKSSCERTVAFTGGNTNDVRVEVNIDREAKICGRDDGSEVAATFVFSLNPLDDTLKGMTGREPFRLGAAIGKFNTAKRVNYGPAAPKRDNRPTEKLQDGDAPRIGKQVKFVKIEDYSSDDGDMEWTAAKMTDDLGKAQYVLLESTGTGYFNGFMKSLKVFRRFAAGNRRFISGVLSALQDSPPELYTYDDKPGDCYGFASARDNAIGLIRPLSSERVAVFHELMEFAAAKRMVKLELVLPFGGIARKLRLWRFLAKIIFLKGRILARNPDGQLVGNIIVDGDALSIAMKGPEDPHYLVRAIQRKVFPLEDVALTRKIRDLHKERSRAQEPEALPWTTSDIEGATPLEGECPPKIFVIGDVHGSLQALREILRAAGLVVLGASPDGKDDRWAAPGAVVIQGGDVVDRGPDSMRAFRYVRDLQTQARRSGGDLVRLMGNHEMYYLLKHAKGVWEGIVEGFKNAGLLRGFSEGLWKNDSGFVKMLRDDIASGRLTAACTYGGKVFVHGAISQELVAKIKSEGFTEAGNPEGFCKAVNAILKKSAKSNKFDSAMFMLRGMPGCDGNGCFNEYPTAMLMALMGYSPEVRDSIAPLSVVKLIAREIRGGSRFIDLLPFDLVVFHDPSFFMTTKKIKALKGKRTKRTMVCADIGMCDSYGDGRAILVFDNGRPLMLAAPLAPGEEPEDTVYTRSLSDLKVAMLTGDMRKKGLELLQRELDRPIPTVKDLRRINCRVSGSDISLLPLLVSVPSMILSGEDWGISEFNGEGVEFSDGNMTEFVHFTEAGKKLMKGLIAEEESRYFDWGMDISARKLILNLGRPGRGEYPLIAFQRGTDIVKKILGDGAAKPGAFTSQAENIDSQGHMKHDAACTRIILGLVEKVPDVVLSGAQKEEWFWIPRKDGILFVNKPEGTAELVRFLVPADETARAEFQSVRAVLEMISAMVAAKGLNYLDGLVLDAEGTEGDIIRHDLLKKLMVQVPIAVSDPASLMLMNGMVPPKHLLSVRSYRMLTDELAVIYGVLGMLPDKLRFAAQGFIYGYRSESGEDSYTVHRDSKERSHDKAFFFLSPLRSHPADEISYWVDPADAARICGADFEVTARKYIFAARFVTLIGKVFLRRLHNADFMEYAAISWDIAGRDGRGPLVRREGVPEEHFLSGAKLNIGGPEEDFAIHLAAYVIFGREFKKAAGASARMAAKYRFFCERIFNGREFTGDEVFRIIAQAGGPEELEGEGEKGTTSPDMAGDEMPHSERNVPLAALIKAGNVFRVDDHGVVPERFIRRGAFYEDRGLPQLVRRYAVWLKGFFGRIAVKRSVFRRLAEIRKKSLIEKAAFDPSLYISTLAATLKVPENSIREELARAGAALSVLVVRDRLALYDGGPITHTRRGVTHGQGAAGIWLGEKLFTAKGVTDDDIARIIVEETLHFLYPKAGHDLIRHSSGLFAKLAGISEGIGETPGKRSCEADMSAVADPGKIEAWRMKYDLPEALAGTTGVNLIDIIEQTLAKQFGGKKEHVIIPFSSTAYLRDKSGRIAWEYIRDADVQVVFFEDVGVARRRKMPMGGGLAADFKKLLAENIERRGGKASLADFVDVSFEDELVNETRFNIYFNKVMPYMKEVFGTRKALAGLGAFVERYHRDVNLLGRYEEVFEKLFNRDLSRQKRVKKLIALAAIRGDEEKVAALMEQLPASGLIDVEALIQDNAVPPGDLIARKFLGERVPAYGKELAKDIKAAAAAAGAKSAVRDKQGKADAAREIERRLRSGSVAARQLLRNVKDCMTAIPGDGAMEHPVDVVVDLSLIAREDLAENMETWAALILMCRDMKNVNFIFELPARVDGASGASAEAFKKDMAGAPAEAEAAALIAENVKSASMCVELDESADEFLRSRVNAPRREGAVEIDIISRSCLESKRSAGLGLKANQYPVAMDGVTKNAAAEVALRHFESALVIGLSEAALAIASSAASAGDAAANVELSDLKKKILLKLQKVYSLFREDVTLTQKTLDNMVSPCSEVRMNLAISLALPPVARMAYQKLIEFHNSLQLFLQAA